MTNDASCRRCRFWRGSECRRHPPVIVPRGWSVFGSGLIEETTNWPDTYEDDWCGEYEPMPAEKDNA